MRKGDIKQGRVLTKKSSESITFQQLVDEFIRQAEIKNMSEYTIKSYRHHTRYFINFIGEGCRCKDIILKTIEEYILYMKNEKGITNPITLNSYVRNISPIIKFGIKRRDILQDFLMPCLKEQETFKEIYSQEELGKLLQKPKKQNFITLRTYTIIWTLASTGIRARELRELKVNNVDLFSRVITVNQTKNKKARRLPISNSFLTVLQEYMSLRGGCGDDFLFCSVYNEILAMSSLQDSVKCYCNERGIDKTSLHLFRHTFITNAVNRNTSPLILQRITGHSTMKELNRYYNSRTEDIVNVIDDIAPKSQSKKSNFKNKNK